VLVLVAGSVVAAVVMGGESVRSELSVLPSLGVARAVSLCAGGERCPFFDAPGAEGAGALEGKALGRRSLISSNVAAVEKALAEQRAMLFHTDGTPACGGSAVCESRPERLDLRRAVEVVSRVVCTAEPSLVPDSS